MPLLSRGVGLMECWDVGLSLNFKYHMSDILSDDDRASYRRCRVCMDNLSVVVGCWGYGVLGCGDVFKL